MVSAEGWACDRRNQTQVELGRAPPHREQPLPAPSGTGCQQLGHPEPVCTSGRSLSFLQVCGECSSLASEKAYNGHLATVVLPYERLFPGPPLLNSHSDFDQALAFSLRPPRRLEASLSDSPLGTRPVSAPEDVGSRVRCFCVSVCTET